MATCVEPSEYMESGLKESWTAPLDLHTRRISSSKPTTRFSLWVDPSLVDTLTSEGAVVVAQARALLKGVEIFDMWMRAWRMSERMMALTIDPASITPWPLGSSSKTFAFRMLSKRLLIWFPVDVATGICAFWFQRNVALWYSGREGSSLSDCASSQCKRRGPGSLTPLKARKHGATINENVTAGFIASRPKCIVPPRETIAE